VHESGRSLTDLRSVGPFTSRFISTWLRDRPDPPTPPPVRDGFITYAHALRIVGEHPEWQRALRADHQMHTEETDGSSSIEAMAKAAAALGRERIAITDHSRTMRITNGMDEARLVAQGERVAAQNAHGSAPLILRGIEMDLTPEGAGDMDPAALDRLDLVLGAFHSKLRLRDDQTERYFRGLENPDIDVLAHPRGRVYNFRAGLSADWERVARHAVECGTALEIDAYPDRQDLDVERLRIVAAEGTWISIGTDAHTPSELAFLEIGVAAAILAGISRDRVLNLLSSRELADRVGLIRATKRARFQRSRSSWPQGSANGPTITLGRKAGSRFVRRDAGGTFTDNQTSAGPSVAQDGRIRAKNTAPKGMKDRGD
jgi:histidinol phosphatase-like PHP family hydrolase